MKTYKEYITDLNDKISKSDEENLKQLITSEVNELRRKYLKKELNPESLKYLDALATIEKYFDTPKNSKTENTIITEQSLKDAISNNDKEIKKLDLEENNETTSPYAKVLNELSSRINKENSSLIKLIKEYFISFNRLNLAEYETRKINKIKKTIYSLANNEKNDLKNIFYDYGFNKFDKYLLEKTINSIEKEQGEKDNDINERKNNVIKILKSKIDTKSRISEIIKTLKNIPQKLYERINEKKGNNNNLSR